jgi:hypothetical protein
MLDAKPKDRISLVGESTPRVLCVIIGGIIGGAFVGLSGFTGAELFGWENMQVPAFPGN